MIDIIFLDFQSNPLILQKSNKLKYNDNVQCYIVIQGQKLTVHEILTGRSCYLLSPDNTSSDKCACSRNTSCINTRNLHFRPETKGMYSCYFEVKKNFFLGNQELLL